MAEGFEYKSPWTHQESTDPQVRKKAHDAFQKLVTRFLINPQQKATTVEGETEVTGRFYGMLATYFSLSIRAAADGMKEDERAKFVKEGLIASGFIDASDPARTTGEFTIISEGYELNSPYWDEKLGRLRRFRNNAGDMKREAGENL